jgi:RNA-directed DNA polymerase
MSGDVHVRFCESVGVQFPRATHLVVLCRTLAEANLALAEVKSWVEQNGLSLNADKTHVGDCRQAGEGFEFLGYRFEAGRRWVRPTSLKRLRGADSAEDQTHAWRQSGDDYRRSQSHASRLV